MNRIVIAVAIFILGILVLPVAKPSIELIAQFALTDILPVIGLPTSFQPLATLVLGHIYVVIIGLWIVIVLAIAFLRPKGTSETTRE